MAVEDDVPLIPEFYKGRSLFITGFSGFMGKALVEKLLWSCPDINVIYVILRAKRGLNPQQRLEKIFNSDLFVRLREQRQEHLKKIVVFNGDVTLPGLGITPEQRSKLCKEVSIVFHCAASVKFDDPLLFAVDINVKGTKAVVDLALEMPKLVSFLHISTAYSNCDKFDIEEKIYPAPADWRKTLDICDKIDKSTLNVLSPKYMNHMPNTYVFAKALGEHILNDHADRLPIVIFRPSIVVSTYEEPFPGWLENMNGPTGLLGGFGTGVVRTCLLESSIQPDFMPVDLAIRGVLVCTYRRVYDKEKGVNIYNWCTRDRSITYQDLIEMGKKVLVDAPMKYVLWRPTTHTTSSSTLFYVYFILFQVIPAYVIDTALRIIGRKPILVKIQRKIFVALRALSYFTLNYFYFHNNKGYDLVNYIKEEDLPEFAYVKKHEEVDNYKYFSYATKYFQKRFLKMKPEDAEIAQKINTVMTAADIIAKSCFWAFLALVTYSYGLLPRFFNSTYDFFFDF